MCRRTLIREVNLAHGPALMVLSNDERASRGSKQQRQFQESIEYPLTMAVVRNVGLSGRFRGVCHLKKHLLDDSMFELLQVADYALLVIMDIGAS